jgi:hypothetical protein
LKYGSTLSSTPPGEPVYCFQLIPCWQALGHRRPREFAGELCASGDQCLEQRAAVLAVRVERGRHRHQPVGVGRSDHRAVVAVADRERVGQRVVQRDVGALVVAHHFRTDRLAGARVAVVGVVLAQEAVHLAAVPGLMLRSPLVGEVDQAVRAKMVWMEGLRAVVLEERAAALLVVEAAHAGQRPEVVIERAVLLDQDHDMLDVLERAVLGRRRGGTREQAFEAGSDHPDPQPGGADVAQRLTPSDRTFLV